MEAKKELHWPVQEPTEQSLPEGHGCQNDGPVVDVGAIRSCANKLGVAGLT